MTKPTYTPLANAPYVKFTVEETGEVFATDNDWKLVWQSAEISNAEARKYEVVIPGRDGTLDLSDALGGVYFENRKIVLTFACINYATERFHLLASTIRNAIDGKMCRITLSDDLGYFWRGRPQVEVSWGGLNHTTVKVEIDAEPFKYSSVSSYESWQWDSFSFVNGVITQQSDIELNNQTKTVVLPQDPARGKPTLWLSKGSVRARLGGESVWHTLKSGANTFPEIRMSATAAQTLYLNGTGTVGVEYRVGSL